MSTSPDERLEVACLVNFLERGVRDKITFDASHPLCRPNAEVCTSGSHLGGECPF